jgi:hypothetical protein
MYHRLLLSAFLSPLLIVSMTAARPIRFAKAQTFPSGITHTSRVAAGDFNGDGYPDLAISSIYNNVAVFLGKGDGTFSGPTTYTVSFYVTGAVAVGDFNSDGKLDMAVVGGDEAGNGLAFFSGNGDGTFTGPTYFATALARSEISAVVGDFNHDGHLDIFTGGNGSSELILGDGKGNFHDGPVVDAFGFDVAVGDFNHDGNLDVAATQAFPSSHPPGVAVLLGNGDGTFQPPQRYSGMQEAVGITAGDFNGDKKIDLAVTDYASFTIVILQGNGDGTFTNIGQWYAGVQPGSVAAADFNMDRKIDLAVADYGGDGVSVLTGKGDGTFPTLVDVPTAAGPSDVAVVDLNHDGSLDLVVVNHGAESVSVLLNAEGTYVRCRSSLNPSKIGQPVTFTASVRGSVPKLPTPSGTITFKDGSKILAQVHLSQGGGSFTTSTLSKGSHNITATYSGDANFNPNQSAVLIQKVQ